jgi:hypothetical protein
MGVPFPEGTEAFTLSKASREFRSLQKFSEDIEIVFQITDNQIIVRTNINIRIVVHVLVHIGMHYFRKCCKRYVAYPNYMHIKISVKKL